MSYQSPVFSIMRFYRSVSSVALSAAWFPLLMLTPTPVVAAETSLPTIELNFQALDNSTAAAPVPAVETPEAAAPAAPQKTEVATGAVKKTAKEKNKTKTAENKKPVFHDNPDHILHLPAPREAAPEVVRKPFKQPEMVTSQSAKPFNPGPVVKRPSVTDQGYTDITPKSFLTRPQYIEQEVVPEPEAKKPEAKKPDAKKPATKKIKAVTAKPEVKKHEVEKPQVQKPSVAEVKPQVEEPMSESAKPEVVLEKHIPPKKSVKEGAAAAGNEEKLPELPALPAPELEPAVPVAAPPVAQEPELPTPPVKELKATVPSAEPTPAPAPEAKTPEVPPVTKVKVVSLDDVSAPPAAPAAKEPELPTPPVKELKAEAPSVEPALPPDGKSAEPLIAPMPMPPKPEDEFSKALNSPLASDKAAAKAPPAPVQPAPQPEDAKAKNMKELFEIRDTPEEVAKEPEVKSMGAQTPPAPVVVPPPLPPLPAPEAKTPPTAPVPAPAPEVKAPVAVPQAAAPVEAAKDIAPAAQQPVFTIKFISTETDLPLSVAPELKGLIEKIKTGNEHVTLKAYASESADQSTTARRVSLSRVLAVRAFMIENGVDKMNINVQAEGSKNLGGEPDRVDVFFGDKK